MVYPTHSMDNDIKKFYPYDFVYKFDDRRNRVVFGHVMDTYDDAIGDYNRSYLRKGQILVSWDNSKEQTCEENQVNLMSRDITAGMVVSRQKNGSEIQKGVCVQTKQTATVQIVRTETVIQNVDKSRFFSQYSFNVDDAVCFGDKVGRIKSADQLFRSWSEEGHQIFSPKIEVYWLLPDGDIEIGEVVGDDVKKLKVLNKRYDVRHGDYFMIKPEPSDVLVGKSKWIREQSVVLLPDKVKVEEKKFDYDPTAEADYSYDSPSEDEDDSTSKTEAKLGVRVLCVETKATVLWQDGTEEPDVSSTELHECFSQDDDHEFFPGDWVMLNKSEEDGWGVIKNVDFTERIAKIHWSAHSLGCSCSSCEDPKKFSLTEHSLYDIVLHERFFFNLIDQDIVYKFTTNGAMLGRMINIDPQNGSIVAQWSDGSTEYCLPGREGFKVLPYLEYIEDHSQAFEYQRSENNKIFEKLSEAVDTDKLQDKPLVDENEGFCLLDEVPERHVYHSTKFEPKNMQKFAVALHREYKLLKESVPAGVWVRAYDNRTDLLSVMIRGAKDTPYEDGLFLFDIQLPADYPENPPRVHFISYTDEKLNPNLYVEGRVCVSLLGTWHGQGSEVWSTNSNLLQLIVSIQGLILVAEPYYNEAGYERDRNTQEGYENSRTYNESVILNVLKSMKELLIDCPREFKSAVLSHFEKNGEKMCRRIDGYCREERPEYPLLPISRGLKLSLELHIGRFRRTLAKFCKD